MEVVVAVMATDVGPLPGVTGFGVKLKVESGGAPEYDKLTALLNVAPTGNTLKL